MAQQKTIVLSLGGSLINPGRINTVFLSRFKKLIIQYAKKGCRFIIVTGGGNTAREYQAALKKFKCSGPDDLDWVGIAATKINAELIKGLFCEYAYENILTNPKVYKKTSKKVLVGSGWVPGFSSDKDAVMLAKTYGAKTVINLSNIRYVYTSDPKKNKTAKPIKEIRWDDFLDLTGRRWKPGAHVPFDPEASKFSQKHGLEVIVCQGKDLANLTKIFKGEKYTGTRIY